MAVVKGASEKKLISMLGQQEGEDDDSWNEDSSCDEKKLIVSDSYDEESGDEPNKTKTKMKTNGKTKSRKRKSKTKRIKAKDYPHLEDFVKQKLLGDEVEDDWRMVGNENATSLEKEWLQITNNLTHNALARKRTIVDIYSLVKERMSERDRSI